tara:strand:+ start:5779 stop:6168 length:390 start_codon:yes stop_codon:yes gene_type:complete
MQHNPTTTLVFLDYWKHAITLLGVGALSAFDFKLDDYREATALEQIDLADDRIIVQLLPLLDTDRQQLLIMMVGCRNQQLALELVARSQVHELDDRVRFESAAMHKTLAGLLSTLYSEFETVRPLRAVS